MIDFLRGKLVSKELSSAVVDVNGVGYEVEISNQTYNRLPNLQQDVLLFTHFIVREDAHVLCGFADQEERQLFRALIKVSGIGPKLGLSILSGVEANVLVELIHQRDSARLTQLPGIGKKTAERIIIEMRDKLSTLMISSSRMINLTEQSQTIKNSNDHHSQDAISALIALGYKPIEATRAVMQVEKEEGATSEMIIREALKAIAQKF